MAQQTTIQERRKQILDYITLNQKAEILELAKVFASTESTIRRDLIELEKTKLIIRTHGGAIRNEQKKAIWQTSSLSNRLERHREEKVKIAQYAATLISDDESILIDGGSTTQLLAPYLSEKEHMLFVTNSPDIADIFLENGGNQVILIGGDLSRDTHQNTGPDAEEHIRKYYVDKFITGVSGIDTEVGCYAAVPQEASLKKTMAKHARECILLVDHSKFHRKAFCTSIPLEDIDIIITDSQTPKEMIEKLRSKNNIKVFVV